MFARQALRPEGSGEAAGGGGGDANGDEALVFSAAAGSVLTPAALARAAATAAASAQSRAAAAARTRARAGGSAQSPAEQVAAELDFRAKRALEDDFDTLSCLNPAVWDQNVPLLLPMSVEASRTAPAGSRSGSVGWEDGSLAGGGSLISRRDAAEALRPVTSSSVRRAASLDMSATLRSFSQVHAPPIALAR